MNAERLLHLADALETVPEQQFRMDYWVHNFARAPVAPTPPGPTRRGAIFGLLPDRPGTPGHPGDPGCGFAGCAMGWAIEKHLFAGLTCDDHVYDNGRKIREPYYRGKWAFAACRELFDLTKDDKVGDFPQDYGKKNRDSASWIFSQHAYAVMPTPKQVAERIRQFVKMNRGQVELKAVG